jgi:hypothetical protein
MLQDYCAELTGGKDQVNLHILYVDPALVDVVVQIQEELNHCSGIIREGSLAYTTAGRARRCTDKQIRDSTITYLDHISRFEENDPAKRKCLALVGNGNLLMNPWFVAYVQGKLFYVRKEPVKKRETPYSSMVVWKDRQVTIEDIHFRDRNKIQLAGFQGEDITDRVAYSTYGQRLMARGRFVTPLEIQDQYYDLRHLLLFPFLGDRGGYLGLNELETDTSKRETALKKLPVELVFNDDTNIARDALAEKGYQEVSRAYREGDFSITGNRISITFKSGVFPHNILVVTEDGKVLSVLVTGRSNTAGLMLDKADKLFEDMMSHTGHRVKDAILLDNGGDVMMRYGEEMKVSSFMFPPRDRLRSVILFVGKNGSSEGIRPVEGWR